MIDPYCYVNSNVLINKFNITDFDELNTMEREFVSVRMQTVHKLCGKFDAIHLKAIHKHLFQDVYGWAGEFRTGDIYKDGSSFCPYQNIEKQINRMHAELYLEKYMKKSYDKSVLAERLEHYFSTVDKIHPFREGNGRTERVMLGMLANNAGYFLDFSFINKDDWIRASKLSAYGVHDVMENIFEQSLRPIKSSVFVKRRVPFVDIGISDDKEPEFE